MITVDYAPKGKDKPIQAANNKKPVTRRRKMKTVKIVLTALVTGACFGSIPYVLEAGVDEPWLYSIPLLPVVVYLLIKICTDLERWYKNDEM